MNRTWDLIIIISVVIVIKATDKTEFTTEAQRHRGKYKRASDNDIKIPLCLCGEYLEAHHRYIKTIFILMCAQAAISV